MMCGVVVIWTAPVVVWLLLRIVVDKENEEEVEEVEAEEGEEET